MSRHSRLSSVCCGLTALLISSAAAQASKKAPGPKEAAKATDLPKAAAPGKHGPRLGVERSETYYFGLLAVARKEACTDLYVTLPIPIDWPEQKIEVLREDTSPHIKRVQYTMRDGVKQLRTRIPNIPEGDEASVVLTLKITRRELQSPDDPSQLVVPEKLDSKFTVHLGAGPYIESNDPKIQALAKEVVGTKTGAWERVRAIYDWVRANIAFEEGPIKGALQGLKDGTGDSEELTSLFIALCRANKIPARMVWVPDHCYAEFYLADRDGNGYWFPCELKGDGSFGHIVEFRPILQKGDNFILPEKSSKRQRYVSEFANWKTGRPRISFVREKVDEKDK